MSIVRLSHFALAMVLTGGWAAAPQTSRPDFSGSWQMDIKASEALTVKKGHEWRVAGAGAGSGTAAASGGGTIWNPLLVVTQSASEIVFERRFEGEVVSREAFKLDGSVSVNARRNISSRSTTVWKGAALVTTGTTHLDFSDGSAKKADGTPITEIVRQFVTTRTLMPDGTMQIESRTTEDGKERVQWSVMVRVKPS